MRASTCGSARRGIVPSMQSMSGASRPIAGNAALRPAQKRRAFGFVGRFAHIARAAAARDLPDARDWRRSTSACDAVDIDDQDGFGILRIAGRAIGLDRFDAAPVHEFHRGGNDAGRDDVGDALARRGHCRERGQQRARDGRLAAGCATSLRPPRPAVLRNPRRRPADRGPRVRAPCRRASRARRRAAPIRRPADCCVVRPYFRQCRPPEFSATLPPMVQAIWLDGSGA